MPISFLKNGYLKFKEQYIKDDCNLLKDLAQNNQNPKILLVSCCDSRVDPAIVFQCSPGEIFTVRNIANIIPPYECDSSHHGTSTALEFGIRVLKIKDIVIMGHSGCGGIKAWMEYHHNFSKKKKKIHSCNYCCDKTNECEVTNLEFMKNWVSIINVDNNYLNEIDEDDLHRITQTSQQQFHEETTNNLQHNNETNNQYTKTNTHNEKISQNEIHINHKQNSSNERKNTTNKIDEYAKLSLINSFDNCMTFPWINELYNSGELKIHLLFFDIASGNLLIYNHELKNFIDF